MFTHSSKSSQSSQSSKRKNFLFFSELFLLVSETETNVSSRTGPSQPSSLRNLGPGRRKRAHAHACADTHGCAKSTERAKSGEGKKIISFCGLSALSMHLCKSRLSCGQCCVLSQSEIAVAAGKERKRKHVQTTLEYTAPAATSRETIHGNYPWHFCNALCSVLSKDKGFTKEASVPELQRCTLSCSLQKTQRQLSAFSDWLESSRAFKDLPRHDWDWHERPKPVAARSLQAHAPLRPMGTQRWPELGIEELKGLQALQGPQRHELLPRRNPDGPQWPQGLREKLQQRS